jgi:hypothetical protein
MRTLKQAKEYSTKWIENNWNIKSIEEKWFRLFHTLLPEKNWLEEEILLQKELEENDVL